MKYCSNCGHELHNNPRFCPTCGFKVLQEAGKEQPKMHKRESKSLGDQVLKIARNKTKDLTATAVKKTAPPQVPPTPKPLRTRPVTSTQKKVIKKGAGMGLWTIIYLVANLILAIAVRSEDRYGLLIFSVLILFIAFLRRNKQKPYPILVKILIGIQMVFTIALIGVGLEDGYWSIHLRYLAMMLFAELMLLFLGNRKRTA